jgi:hypothetical protein
VALGKVAVGSTGVAGIAAGSTVIGVTLLDVRPVESVTVQSTVAAPAAVGVPEMTTFVALGVTTRPSGVVPVSGVIAHVVASGPVPPVMGRVWVVYRDPTVASGRVADGMVGAVGTKPVGLTVIGIAFTDAGPDTPVTEHVTVAGPAVVGVPETVTFVATVETSGVTVRPAG